MLMEVMVSLAILSLGLVIIIQSFASSLRALRSSQNITRAVFLAEQKLGEMEREGYFEEESEGSFGEKYPNLEWKIDSSPLKIDDEEIENLSTVTLTLFEREREIIKIVTYLPSPEEGLPGAEDERE